MGVLASIARTPLSPFQIYQDTWSIRDVRILLKRFDRDPSAYSFKLTRKAWRQLVRDLPVREEVEEDVVVNGVSGQQQMIMQQTMMQQQHSSQQSHQSQQQQQHPRTPSSSKSHRTITSPTPNSARIHAASPQPNQTMASIAAASLSLPPINPSLTPGNSINAQTKYESGGEEEKEPATDLSAQQLRIHSPALYLHPPAVVVAPLQLHPSSDSMHHAATSPTSSADASLLSSDELFQAWLGTDTKDDDRVDYLLFASALICLCKGKFATKVKLLFELFDFDADGILSRTELSTLTRSLCQGLYRVAGLLIINPPSFVFLTKNGGANADRDGEKSLASSLGMSGGNTNGSNTSRSTSDKSYDRSSAITSNTPHEPNSKQCERWNELHVRRFESALRSGKWNLDGMMEFAESSAVIVHLLCVGIRTSAGSVTTTDAAKIQQRYHHTLSLQRPNTTTSNINTGGSMQRVRGVKYHSTREEALLGVHASDRTTSNDAMALSAASQPNTARNVKSAGAKAVNGSSTARSASDADASAPAPSTSTPTTTTTTTTTTTSSSSQSRFKFSGRNTAREIKNLRKLFDDMDIDSSGYLSLEYLRKPKKYTDPFLLRDITAVFQEYKPPQVAVSSDASVGATNGDPSTSSSQQQQHYQNEISFSEMLDILYRDLTPDQSKLMHSWIPAPINKESVKILQQIFDRLDTEFTGKVKFSKIMNAFKVDHQDNEMYQKLIEPFSRLRPHRLEIAVNIRELLTALFNRTHSKQLKKILNWSRPSKLLTQEQQHELIRLFQRYDTRNEGRFPMKYLKKHLLERGLPLSEVEEMMKDMKVVNEGVFLAQQQKQPQSQQTNGKNATSNNTSSVNTPHTILPHHTPADASSIFSTVPSANSYPDSLFSSGMDSSISPNEPMITLQEFQIFYRDMWDVYVNFDINSLSAFKKKDGAGGGTEKGDHKRSVPSSTYSYLNNPNKPIKPETD